MEVLSPGKGHRSGQTQRERDLDQGPSFLVLEAQSPYASFMQQLFDLADHRIAAHHKLFDTPWLL